MAGLYINHNLMALNASRNLGITYSNLSSSINKLSSGLRINSAADDAAGMAVSELMKSDVAVLQQGQRNANDAISMLQTMDGAAQVIDEKLTRMKELAEQAATGTYTDQQRSIMNNEFDEMRDEIDRIAQATTFNGVKMLNVGSAGTAEMLSAAGDVNAMADTANITSAFTSLKTNATQVLSAAGNVNAFGRHGEHYLGVYFFENQCHPGIEFYGKRECVRSLYQPSFPLLPPLGVPITSQ